jgi:hypothetical protein
MSNLVADFLINPVLRQARRFSGNTIHRIDPVTNQHTRQGIPPRNEEPSTEAAEPIGTASAIDEEGSVSGRPLVSSPIQEDGSLEEQLAAFDRSRAGRATMDPPSAIPSHLASFSSDRMSIDDDISDNPSFGIPSRFQTGSPMSTSFSSTSQNQRNSPTDVSRRSTEDISQPTPTAGTTRQRNSSLPEDDGMRDLRRRIIKIQEMDVSPGEKARLMHNLLTEGYSQSQISLHGKSPPRAHSPASMVSQDRPVTPGSLSSFSFWQTSTNDTPPQSSPSNSDHTFHLSQNDLKPTYAPIEVRPTANSDSGDSDDTELDQSLGCRHYKRNVKLQCFTCGGWYTCRFCHDEVEDHVLNRKETRNMLCMLCGCAQRASDLCTNCGERAAYYYCGICKLWDNDVNKSIYHCIDCGICRVGRGIGKDYIHCKVGHGRSRVGESMLTFVQTCGVCVSIANEKSHKCIERASDCDCPICGEYLFSSLQSVVFMRCGHSIHRSCRDALMKTSYKCPICSQSVVNMETQFRNLDRAIDSQPMPPQFQDTKAIVSCNDCYAKSLVKYHWLGLKCAICDSYNTVQIRILSDPDVEVPREMSETAGSHLVQVSGNNSNADVRAQGLSFPGSARSRRHSSHIRPLPTGADSEPLRFSPYNIPQRMGRSVSPFRTSTFSNNPMVAAGPSGDGTESDEDEDIVDFWGGDAPRSPASSVIAMEEDDESDDDSVLSMEDGDEDGDDGDEEDHMELLGHR